VSIDVINESGVDVDERRLVDLARVVLDQLKIHPQADLCVKLVDTQAMEHLHVHWMDEPGPTDVLAFPMDELRPGRDDEAPEEGVLGDVVICPQVADEQARQAGHPATDEVDLLLTHGILHLLGYDHADPEDKAEMFGLQDQLLSRWREGRRRR
jgi:probable rRNA maturation factor